MRAVFGLVLLVGMGLAGFAIYLVKEQFDSQDARLNQVRERAASAVVTVEVYAPSRALTYGELITPEDVTLIQYARDFLPEGVFQTEEELFPDGLDTPRVVTRPMEINEPILAVKVTEPGAPRGITALLRPGMRAYPLPDRVTQAFSQELRPTDRVDIYWNGRLSSGRNSTSLIMTGLEVIAVDQPGARGRGGRGVVLEVTPQDFAALSTAQNAGSLSLTPVGTGDNTVVQVETTDIEAVLGIEAPVVEEAPAPVVEEAPKQCFITQRSGTESIRVQIQCPDE